VRHSAACGPTLHAAMARSGDRSGSRSTSQAHADDVGIPLIDRDVPARTHLARIGRALGDLPTLQVSRGR